MKDKALFPKIWNKLRMSISDTRECCNILTNTVNQETKEKVYSLQREAKWSVFVNYKINYIENPKKKFKTKKSHPSKTDK